MEGAWVASAAAAALVARAVGAAGTAGGAVAAAQAAGAAATAEDTATAGEAGRPRVAAARTVGLGAPEVMEAGRVRAVAMVATVAAWVV